MRFTRGRERRTIGSRRVTVMPKGGWAVPTLGVIDLVIGLTFAFGITAAVSSAVTELVARSIGLRGAYLLGGLSELLDGGEQNTILADVQAAYRDTQNTMRTTPPPAAKMQSATAALLGSPVLDGQISGSGLMLVPAGKLGRPPELRGIQGARNLWSQRRSLPSHIPARSFAEAVIDLVAPDATGQMTMTAIRQNVDSLPHQCRCSRHPCRLWPRTPTKTSAGSVPRLNTGTTTIWTGYPAGTSGMSPRSRSWPGRS